MWLNWIQLNSIMTKKLQSNTCCSTSTCTENTASVCRVSCMLWAHLAVRGGDHVDVVADQLEREAPVHEGEASLQRHRHRHRRCWLDPTRSANKTTETEIILTQESIVCSRKRKRRPFVGGLRVQHWFQSEAITADLTSAHQIHSNKSHLDERCHR